MKKNVSVLKNMDQFFIEENNPRELEELYVILIKSVSKHKESANIEAKNWAIKWYELYNCLNPRYFEDGITPKEAQINLDALNPRSNQGLIRIF